MRIRLSVVTAIVLLTVAVTATVALAATRSVSVRKSGSRYLFSPRSLSINRGDTVRWSWRGSVPHNVAGRGFRSRTANRLTYSRTFRRRGTYRVVCQIHAANGQRMTIRVR
ncbi:MAG TPA: plastocyanin/azurin family copper-binding protein [Solirubrobacteraceae bacterium]|nr:plastocyanin/azurin family copper-binding protein [Solirubrobacteraceae bacterium]